MMRQYADASGLLAEMLAAPEPEPNQHMRRAIGRLAMATMGSVGLTILPYAALFGFQVLGAVLLSPLMLLQLPVNPQGRGDYHLSASVS